MSKSMIDALHAEARALTLEQAAIGVPPHILTGEAVDVAGFFKRYYEPELAPKTKVVLRPGLASVGKTKLSPQAGKRITLLVDEVQAAQTEYQLSADAPAGDEEIQRGRFVVSELTAALEFLFDDGVEDERDAQLARVRQANEDQSSTDALAGALAEHAGCSPRRSAACARRRGSCSGITRRSGGRPRARTSDELAQRDDGRRRRAKQRAVTQRSR